MTTTYAHVFSRFCLATLTATESASNAQTRVTSVVFRASFWIYIALLGLCFGLLLFCFFAFVVHVLFPGIYQMRFINVYHGDCMYCVVCIKKSVIIGCATD